MKLYCKALNLGLKFTFNTISEQIVYNYRTACYSYLVFPKLYATLCNVSGKGLWFSLDFQRVCTTSTRSRASALLCPTQHAQQVLAPQSVRRETPKLIYWRFRSTLLRSSGPHAREQSSLTNSKANRWTRTPTFSSLAFIVEVMVVGWMNWKEGAALFGYCAGNFTSTLTRWLLQCTDTVQLLSTASICNGQIDTPLETRQKGSSDADGLKLAN